MSNIWFPLPVALFLRRVVNIISTLSITHHYLFPFPPRPTIADNNAEYRPSPSFSRVGRDLQCRDGRPRQVAERNVWVTVVENGLLDRILHGMNFLPKPPLDPTFFFLYIASRKLSIPWFHWPAQLSLFRESTYNYVEQVNDSKNTPFPEPNSNSNPREPQEPPDPVDRAREEREDVDKIHRLIQNPVLYNPLRAPRYPIVLCHGAPLANHD